MTSRHLVVMAAGTGGHVMPGLAVAREMQQRGWTVSWLGTSHGIPSVRCGCRVCCSPDPRDRRTRCGITVRAGDATLVTSRA